MKKFLCSVLLATNFVLANECERLYLAFLEEIPDQNVTICRVNIDGRTDVIGMYFYKQHQKKVLFYGENYDVKLFSATDSYAARVKCIENGQYKKFTQFMTGEEIAKKLLSFKNCNTEHLKSTSNENYSSESRPSNENEKKGVMTDLRDDQKYKTVRLGDKIWMAENMSLKTDNSVCFRAVDGENEADCKIYGRYYPMSEAINSVCPEGWRLPGVADFMDLFSRNGIDLKSKNGWNSVSRKAGNGLDSYGFNALPSGGCVSLGQASLCAENGINAFYWTNTVNYSADSFEDFLSGARKVSSIEYAYIGRVHDSIGFHKLNEQDLEHSRLPVRCVRDFKKSASSEEETYRQVKAALQIRCRDLANEAVGVAQKCKSMAKGSNKRNQCVQQFKEMKKKAEEVCAKSGINPAN